MAKPNIPNQPRKFKKCNDLSIQTGGNSNFFITNFTKMSIKIPTFEYNVLL